MFELQVIDPVPGLEELGASVQLREQPYGVVRPILTSGHARVNEELLVVSLHIDGTPLGTLEALDALPGAVVVQLLKAIARCNALYGLTESQDPDAAARDEGRDEAGGPSAPGER
jgi:hypothetical protein